MFDATAGTAFYASDSVGWCPPLSSAPDTFLKRTAAGKLQVQNFIGTVGTLSATIIGSITGTLNGAVILPTGAGTLAAPPFSFIDNLGTGIKREGGDATGGVFVGNANIVGGWYPNNQVGMWVDSTLPLGWRVGGTGTDDTSFTRLAAGSVALGNGTFNDITGTLRLGVVQIGGTSNFIDKSGLATRVVGDGSGLAVGGASALSSWGILGSGSGSHLVPINDGAQDIGANNPRVRTGYFGTVDSNAYKVGGNNFSASTIGPSAPAGTTSTTLVMAGLAGSITTRTGKIVLTMSGVAADSLANDGVKLQMSYGTGGAPSNGGALTGTQVGPIQQFNAQSVATETCPYGATWVVTGLSVGTAYWFDTAFAAITGGTATITQASMTAYDIP